MTHYPVIIYREIDRLRQGSVAPLAGNVSGVAFQIIVAIPNLINNIKEHFAVANCDESPEEPIDRSFKALGDICVNFNDSYFMNVIPRHQPGVSIHG